MEWISVKKQLPPNKDNVIFFNGKDEVRYGFFIEEKPPINIWATENSIWMNDLSYDEIGTCSHWMPLPLPPED
jgi:hypothetical protein